MTDNRLHVFVYGTLMRGRSNHRAYMAGSKFIGSATLINHGLYKVSWYPGIVATVGAKVLGEVYEIDQQTLTQIDQLEDEGRLYQRERVKVILESGEEIKALTYLWNGLVRDHDYVPYEKQPWKERKYT